MRAALVLPSLARNPDEAKRLGAPQTSARAAGTSAVCNPSSPSSRPARIQLSIWPTIASGCPADGWHHSTGEIAAARLSKMDSSEAPAHSPMRSQGSPPPPRSGFCGVCANPAFLPAPCQGAIHSPSTSERASDGLSERTRDNPHHPSQPFFAPARDSNRIGSRAAVLPCCRGSNGLKW